MNWSPNSGSHLAAYVWSLMGGSAVETPLCPAFTVTGCLEVKGWAKVRRVGFEGEEEEEEWPSGCVSPSPRTRIHLSNSSGPHTETDSSLTFHSLSFDMGCLCSDSTGGESWLSLYWNYSSVDLAQIWDPEAAEISGTGYRSDKILFFFRTWLKRLGLHWGKTIREITEGDIIRVLNSRYRCSEAWRKCAWSEEVEHLIVLSVFSFSLIGRCLRKFN